MNPRRLSLLAALLGGALLSTGGCSKEAPPPQRFYAFGTLVQLSLRGADIEQTRAATRLVRGELERLHQLLHPWLAEGELARVNRELAAGVESTAPPEILELLEYARAASEASTGLFDPALGAWVRLWGFHRDELPTRPPPPEALAALLAEPPHLEQLHRRGSHLVSENRQLCLDFGAIAKGYAIDHLRRRLQAMGIQHALLDIGGDLGVLTPSGARPWRIGLRHPRKTSVYAQVELGDTESIVTSGDYERYFDLEGRRYHHIIDPRSGRPAEGSMAVTVIHHDAAWADAAATALFVAGPETWRTVAESMKVDTAFLIDSAGQLHMTAAMATRLVLNFNPEQGLP